MFVFHSASNIDQMLSIEDLTLIERRIIICFTIVKLSRFEQLYNCIINVSAAYRDRIYTLAEIFTSFSEGVGLNILKSKAHVMQNLRWTTLMNIMLKGDTMLGDLQL